MGIFQKKYESVSDEKLMGMISKKDKRAFEEIYDRYSKRMVNYFFKMLWQNEEKAQDIMQDLFAKIIEKPQLFDENRNFKTWIYSVAHNMCKNEYRKAEVRKNTSYEIKGDVEGEKGIDTIEKLDLKDFQNKLREVLKTIDETKAETFKFRYFEELSIKEISEIMECSEGTVKSRIFYTLKILNTELEEFRGILLNE